MPSGYLSFENLYFEWNPSSVTNLNESSILCSSLQVVLISSLNNIVLTFTYRIFTVYKKHLLSGLWIRSWYTCKCGYSEESYNCRVLNRITMFNMVPTFKPVDKTLNCDLSLNTTKHFFPMVLLISLYHVLALHHYIKLDEILNCYPLMKASAAIFPVGSHHYVEDSSNFPNLSIYIVKVLRRPSELMATMNCTFIRFCALLCSKKWFYPSNLLTKFYRVSFT